MSLVDHATRELQAAGLFDEDSDYNGMLGEAVLELIETFANQGHSGFSAMMTIQLFDLLANYKPLSDLTDNPHEWMEVVDGLWQSRRNSEAFSNDGGKTYRLNSNQDEVFESSPA